MGKQNIFGLPTFSVTFVPKIIKTDSCMLELW